MPETYKVVMTGGIQEGKPLQEVKANVARLFKLEGAQLDKLFSGKPVSVRRGITRQQADKICAALLKAGAVARVKADATDAKLATASPKSAQSQPHPQTKAPKADSPSAKQPSASVQRELECPRCGHEQPYATTCGLCKMDLSLHIQRLQRRERIRLNRDKAVS